MLGRIKVKVNTQKNSHCEKNKKHLGLECDTINAIY